MAKTKSELRKEIKSLLKENLSSGDDYRKNHSEEICNRILHSDEYKNATLVLGYMPMESEVDILSVLTKALNNGKRVAVPRIIPDTSIMDFYFVNQGLFEKMQIGSYGIFEPDESFEKLNISDFENTSIKENILILVPGLGFTLYGNRIGRGKGFYDIFMSRFENEVVRKNQNIIWKKIGICFPCQVLEHIPVSENDINVDSIVF